MKETQPRRQGLAAATSWKRAGKLAVPAARDTTTRASSRGWRRASRTRWENSGSSSSGGSSIPFPSTGLEARDKFRVVTSVVIAPVLLGRHAAG